MTNQELQELANLPRKERKQTIAQLLKEGKISGQEYSDVLYPMIEAKRGIVRKDGNIVHTNEWITKRLKVFEEKKRILTERLLVIEAEINKYKSELKAK